MPQALEEIFAANPNQLVNGTHADYLLPPENADRAVADLAARFRAVMEARQQVPVARYATATMTGTFDNNLHPRGMPDNAGEFAPKGQSSGAAGVQGGGSPAPQVQGEGFASPNEEENLSFDQASQNARSDAMKKWVGGVRTIAQACGLGAAVRPGIGDWSTGAEQSAEIEFSGAQDYDQLKYTMCVIGRQARQFAVIPFVEDHEGPDSIWEIDAPDNVEHVRSVLDKYQIQHRTLIDMGGGQTKVVIYDPGSQLDAQTDGVAAEYGTQRSRKRGHGEFFPGSANDRQHAVEQYDAFIADYEQRHPERPHWTHPGQGANSAGASNGVHDAQPQQGDLKTRMSQALSRYGRTTFVESQHPRGQPENAGEFAATQGAAAPAPAQPQQVTGGAPPVAAHQPPYDAVADRLGEELDHAQRSKSMDVSLQPHAYQAIAAFRTQHHDPNQLLQDLAPLSGMGINPVSALNHAGFKQSPQALRNELDQAAKRIREPAPDDWLGTGKMLDEIDHNPEMSEVADRIAKFKENNGGQDRNWSRMKYSDGMGNYTPERQALHTRIAQSMLNHDSVAKPGTRPQAMVLLGAPGAGKTTLAGRIGERLNVQFTNISNDDIKAGMPEYEGWNSALLHDEAGDVIAHDLIPAAINGNCNLLWDGTGKDSGKTQQVVNSLAAKGYDVHIGYASLPAAKAAYRATNRFLGNAFGHRDPNAPPGRYVDPHYIVHSVDGLPGQTYQMLKNNPNVKSWTSIDTDQPLGSPMKIIDEGERK